MKNKAMLNVCPEQNLQQNIISNANPNQLIVKEEMSFAESVCNTSYVSIKHTDTHAANAGIVSPDTPQHIRDIENMSEPALKKAYPKEHNSWRSRRDTAKKEALPWSPVFDEFAGFLRHVGPKPKLNYQMDKVIKDKGYVLGNVRWASPTENVLNRDATRFLTHNGETHPVSVWARKMGIPKETIFGRLRRGWSASAAITGELGLRLDDDSDHWPWPENNRKAWEGHFQSRVNKNLPRLLHYIDECQSRLAVLADEHFRIKNEYPVYLLTQQIEELPDSERAFMENHPKEYAKWSGLFADARNKIIRRCPTLKPYGMNSFYGALYENLDTIMKKLR